MTTENTTFLNNTQFLGFPDYSNAKEITITKDTGYTVTENGWISVKCSDNTGGTVSVNGVIVAICTVYPEGAWAYAQQSVFPVSAGDKVESNRTRGTNTWFIPCK